jgi:undecaprenyl-diphosphatase
MNIDKTIFLFLNQFTEINFYLDFLFYFFASVLPYLFIFAIFLFFIRNIKKNTWFSFSALFAGFFARYVLVEVVRYFFPRTRPFLMLEEVKLLLPYKESMSFPSGHTAFLFGIATITYFYNKKIGIFLYVLSFFGGLSRVVMGIHWPADVFVGALVGLVAGILVNETITIIKKRLTKK